MKVLFRMDREKRSTTSTSGARCRFLEVANRESTSREDGRAERHGLTAGNAALEASC